jgi:hypothetical protein
VNWSSGAAAAGLVGRRQPAILLRIIRREVGFTKTKLAGPNTGELVFVRNDEHRLAVVTRLPDLSEAFIVTPESRDADEIGELWEAGASE